MGDDEYSGPDSPPQPPPKLPLSKPQPWKPREPAHMLMPPLHPSASIPFQWEEAPGKPRAAAAQDDAAAAVNKATRCLALPPRLMLHDVAKITTMPSPTAVLDGPYVRRSLTLACTFSFRKGPPTASCREEQDGEEVKAGRASVDFTHNDQKVKITRIGRRKSFFSLPSMNTNQQGICSSLRRALVPWKKLRRN